MCGIYFKLCQDIDSDEFSNFMKLKHRGPDKSTFSFIQNENFSVIYGFHRLRIVGSIEYDQPFIQDGVYVLCNGEIYNYKSLISNHNLSPRTDSDCEVILLLYKKYGIQKVLQELNGEFAFIIYDSTNNTIYCARDPFGVRPLFISNKQDTLQLSSEAKAQSEECKQVQPGMYYTFKVTANKNNVLISESKQEYYEYSKVLSTFTSSKLIEHLEMAVYKRVFQTNRNIGFLLSGGLDSSLVLSMAMKYLPRNRYPIQVFSIGYVNSNLEFDSPDITRAIQVVKFLKAKYGESCIEHHIVKYNQTNALSVLNSVIYMLESFDITTVRASVPMYILSNYISKKTNVKIVLSGEGSDELFGGYIYFKYAPNETEFLNEKIKLLKQIHFFDGLRADRMISAHGLELRVPFLDKNLVSYVLSLPISVSTEKYNEIEKYLLRSILNESYLPNSIIWAQKEAFSDGVGHSWIHNLKSSIENNNTFKVISWRLLSSSDIELNSEYFTNIDKKYLHFDFRKERTLELY